MKIIMKNYWKVVRDTYREGGGLWAKFGSQRLQTDAMGSKRFFPVLPCLFVYFMLDLCVVNLSTGVAQRSKHISSRFCTEL